MNVVMERPLGWAGANVFGAIRRRAVSLRMAGRWRGYPELEGASDREIAEFVRRRRQPLPSAAHRAALAGVGR